MGSPWEIVMFYLLDIGVNSVPEKYIIISISYTNFPKMTRKIFRILELYNGQESLHFSDDHYRLEEELRLRKSVAGEHTMCLVDQAMG